jgi:hypothetical protein
MNVAILFYKHFSIFNNLSCYYFFLISCTEVAGIKLITHNGPAVEGVNVDGAVRRYESQYFSQIIVPAGKPPWRNFCHPGER